eukprot:TRINITY_DN2091_c0_g1_i1.p1 TRINITY_DN2091_c0_g1~~TRINITY_DN2091_c0_g1_i1.p1  ORF type:complete len:999 (-),score=206.57 TRINITY_DN2091_c0_g1_i1:379-3375(-)
MCSKLQMICAVIVALIIGAAAANDCSAYALSDGGVVTGSAPIGFRHFVLRVPSAHTFSVRVENPTGGDDLDLYVRRDTCSVAHDWDYEKKDEPLALQISHCSAQSATNYYISIWNDNWFAAADFRLSVSLFHCQECSAITINESDLSETNTNPTMCMTNILSPKTPFASGVAPARSYVHYEVNLNLGDYVVVELRNPSGKDDLDLYMRKDIPPSSSYDLVDKIEPLVLGVYQCNEMYGSKIFFSVYNANYFSEAGYEIEARFVSATDQCDNEIVMDRARLLATLSTLAYNEIASSYVIPYAATCIEWQLVTEIRDPRDNNFKVVIHRNDQLRWVILSFEGTDTVLDWKTDADVIKINCIFNGYNCGQIHRGFHNAYRLMEPQIDAFLSNYALSQQYDLVVTGHSLGGALATLCVTDVLTDSSVKEKWKGVSLLTIGSPRVGDSAFSSFFNSLVGMNKRSSRMRMENAILSTASFSHRIVTAGTSGTDLVTQIPYDRMGYETIHHPILVTPVTMVGASSVDLHRTSAYLEAIEDDLIPGHQQVMCTDTTLGCSVTAEVIYSGVPQLDVVHPGSKYYLADLPSDRALYVHMAHADPSDALEFSVVVDQCPGSSVANATRQTLDGDILLKNCGGASSHKVYIGVENMNVLYSANMTLYTEVRLCDDCLDVKCDAHEHCHMGECVCDQGYEFSPEINQCLPQTFIMDSVEVPESISEPVNATINVSVNPAMDAIITWSGFPTPSGSVELYEVAIGTPEMPESLVPYTPMNGTSILRRPNLDFVLGRTYSARVKGLVSTGEWMTVSKEFTIWQRDIMTSSEDVRIAFATPSEEIVISATVSHGALHPSMILVAAAYGESNAPEIQLDYNDVEKPALFAFGLRLAGYESFALSEPIRFQLRASDPDTYLLLMARNADGEWVKASETCPRPQRSTDIHQTEACIAADYVVVKSTKDDVVELVAHSPWISAAIAVAALAGVAVFGVVVRRMRQKEIDAYSYSRIPY